MYFLQIISNGLTTAEKYKDMAIAYAPKLLGAVLVYIIGAFIIRQLSALIDRILQSRNYDPSLRTFLSSLFKVAMNILLILTVIGMLGVQTTQFAALIAGAGIAIGAALNGSLGNLAGGVMLLFFKPFKVGDMIEAQNVIGTVKEMGIFNTTLLSPDNKTIILPNGALSTGTITNYTSSGYLRVDLVMAVAPDQDIDKARSVAVAAMLQHPKVLQGPAPEVSVLKVADGMTTLAIRPYTKQPDYWDVYFGAQELVKKAWDAAGVQGPIPHRVIINK